MTRPSPRWDRHGRALLTSFQVKLAGRKDWDCRNALEVFWNPQVWNACFLQFFAQLRDVDIHSAKQHKRFALGFVLHAYDGDGTFVSSASPITSIILCSIASCGTISPPIFENRDSRPSM